MSQKKRMDLAKVIFPDDMDTIMRKAMPKEPARFSRRVSDLHPRLSWEAKHLLVWLGLFVFVSIVGLMIGALQGGQHEHI